MYTFIYNPFFYPALDPWIIWKCNIFLASEFIFRNAILPYLIYMNTAIWENQPNKVKLIWVKQIICTFQITDVPNMYYCSYPSLVIPRQPEERWPSEDIRKVLTTQTHSSNTCCHLARMTYVEILTGRIRVIWQVRKRSNVVFSIHNDYFYHYVSKTLMM
jgi:hypothetical protein